MESLKLAFISVVQGITELLPISSSGHILLFGKIFSMNVSSSLLIAFHLGTTIAILIFFRKKLFKDIFSRKKIIFYAKICVSTIPVGIVGVLFNDIISEKLRGEWVIAVSMILWGIVMIFVERNKRLQGRKEKNIENISWKDSIILGLFQSIALIPGTSRSGITTIGGILLGLNKYTALEYSFILGIPVLLGSYVWSTIHDNMFLSMTQTDIFNYILILLITFVVGLISLKFLEKIKKSNWLTIFGIYRIVVGLGIFLSIILD